MSAPDQSAPNYSEPNSRERLEASRKRAKQRGNPSRYARLANPTGIDPARGKFAPRSRRDRRRR